MTRAKSQIKLLIDTPSAFIRPKNTDWLYMKVLAGLSRYEPLDIRFSRGVTDSVEESAHYVAGRLGLGRKSGPAAHQRPGRRIAAEARRADVVLCHRRFPMDVDRPVIWQHAVLDPRMRTAAGGSAAAVAQAYGDQGPVYASAAAVQVSTEAEARRHAEVFPALGDRFHAVPFFLPYIDPITDLGAASKQSDDKTLRILFVGREARRKGLDLLIEAVMGLPADLLTRVTLDVVSNLSDGPIAVPAHPAIRVHAGLPRDEVLRLMRMAHIFAMPSRFESYGFTFVEAMANGCAVLGPDWEVQSELLDNGRAGVNVAPQAETVRAALKELCSNSEARRRLAQRGLERYRSYYAPDRVARAYYEMIERAVAHGDN